VVQCTSKYVEGRCHVKCYYHTKTKKNPEGHSESVRSGGDFKAIVLRKQQANIPAVIA
jgi:hypothetical protein